MLRHHGFVAPALLSVVSLSLVAAAPAPAPSTQPAPYQIPPARYPAPQVAKKAGEPAPAVALNRKLPELRFKPHTPGEPVPAEETIELVERPAAAAETPELQPQMGQRSQG